MAGASVTVSFAPILPDGNYSISLSGATDVAGNFAGAGAAFPFFVLAGDANRDRAVTIADFAILAGRFNLPGTFSQGDFNYNGTVEIGDFSILAGKFNNSLPAARPPLSVAGTAGEPAPTGRGEPATPPAPRDRSTAGWWHSSFDGSRVAGDVFDADDGGLMG